MNEKTYPINEIFYSLQGEGRWTGRAAIFIRFSGCNLKCPFCDTDFKDNRRMTATEIIDTIKQWPDCGSIVLTGGEPTLWIDDNLLFLLQEEGYYIAIETNGTRQFSGAFVDWITVSPKNDYLTNAPKIALTYADEVKVVFDLEHTPHDFGINAEHYYVQPCDTGDAEKNKEIITKCVEWIKKNPQWQLSLQTQKILNVR